MSNVSVLLKKIDKLEAERDALKVAAQAVVDARKLWLAAPAYNRTANTIARDNLLQAIDDLPTALLESNDAKQR